MVASDAVSKKSFPNSPPTPYGFSSRIFLFSLHSDPQKPAHRQGSRSNRFVNEFEDRENRENFFPKKPVATKWSVRDVIQFYVGITAKVFQNSIAPKLPCRIIGMADFFWVPFLIIRRGALLSYLDSSKNWPHPLADFKLFGMMQNLTFPCTIQCFFWKNW